MAKNIKYSFNDFTGLSFTDRPASEFNNTEIVGSCFYQEARETDLEVLKDIFPNGMVGVTFQRCNLDNVWIPPGNIIDNDSCHRRIKVQNDLDDWLLDENLKPIEPMDKQRRVLDGRSINHIDIPPAYIREEIITKAEWNLTYGVGIIPENSWFKEIPQIQSTQIRRVTSRDTVRNVVYYTIRGKGRLTR